jgi:hypothetical protein
LSGFRKLAEREVHQGRRITVAVATFLSPDGVEFERDVVHHPGAVSVVPVTAQRDHGLLVRQYRPAGELAEEVGMRAGRLEPLAEFFNSAGFSDEYSYVFLALDLDPCPTEAHSIEEHHMVVEQVALANVADLIAQREIVDAKTIIGLALARGALPR